MELYVLSRPDQKGLVYEDGKCVGVCRAWLCNAVSTRRITAEAAKERLDKYGAAPDLFFDWKVEATGYKVPWS